ncbi:MAG: TonB-dependent receptor, partial [Opitutus sp.]
QRGARSTFFVFADTVATKGSKGSDEAHGWMGVRFQPDPCAEPSEVVLHVRMWDRENVLQHEALGIAGTNLIYAAFYYRDDPIRFIESLVDNLGSTRLEVDMLTLSGPAFAHMDNRLMALLLVKHGMTNAVMFSPRGEVLQPSETLYKKAVLIERSNFRPVSRVNVDMADCAMAQFVQEPGLKGKDVVVLMEITINNQLQPAPPELPDLLARVDLLGTLGFTTLVSNYKSYSEYFRMPQYLRRHTREMVGMMLGINNLVEIFNEKYYENLDGGILESFGRMFRHAVKLYVYPMRQDTARRHAEIHGISRSGGAPAGGIGADGMITARNVQIAEHLRNLYAHLLGNGHIDGIVGFDPDVLGIVSADIMELMAANDSSWEKMVPAPVAAMIKARRLFGYTAPQSKQTALKR